MTSRLRGMPRIQPSTYLPMMFLRSRLDGVWIGCFVVCCLATGLFEFFLPPGMESTMALVDVGERRRRLVRYVGRTPAMASDGRLGWWTRSLQARRVSTNTALATASLRSAL